MDLVERAALYSRAAHQAVGQVRKYTDQPYFYHPLAVAEIIRTLSYRFTPQMIAAALLHDVLEDTEVSFFELKSQFGFQVAGLVYELTDQYTDPEIGNRAHRKALECERLSRASPEAQTIKYADIIHNTQDIAEYDPEFAKVYFQEARNMLEVMVDGDTKLRHIAGGTVGCE